MISYGTDSLDYAGNFGKIIWPLLTPSENARDIEKEKDS